MNFKKNLLAATFILMNFFSLPLRASSFSDIAQQVRDMAIQAADQTLDSDDRESLLDDIGKLSNEHMMCCIALQRYETGNGSLDFVNSACETNVPESEGQLRQLAEFMIEMMQEQCDVLRRYAPVPDKAPLLTPPNP